MTAEFFAVVLLVFLTVGGFLILEFNDRSRGKASLEKRNSSFNWQEFIENNKVVDCDSAIKAVNFIADTAHIAPEQLLPDDNVSTLSRLLTGRGEMSVKMSFNMILKKYGLSYSCSDISVGELILAIGNNAAKRNPTD